MSSNSVLAEGTLYVNRLVAGVFVGQKRWPGITKLEIKPNSDLVEATTKDKGQYGQVVAAVAVAKPTDISITISQVTGQALAMALQGEDSAQTQASGAVTSQAVTVSKGLYFPLGFRNIAAAGFTVKDVTDTTTYVKGTDYDINYASGQLYIIPTGGIANSSVLHVSYTHNAVDFTRVKGSTTAQVRGALFLDGSNMVDGRPLFIDVFEALLTSDKAVDFMSDKPIELSMKGRMVTPDGKDAPYYVDYDNAFS